MMISISISDEVSGGLRVQSLPAAVVAAAKGLVQAPELYFVNAAAAASVPLSSLVFSHFELQSTLAAARLMRRAAQNQQRRRLPIDVRQLDDGRYLVVDGNSTAVIALAAGWRSLPAMVETPAPAPAGLDR